MSFVLENAFSLIYWLAILGGMAWWSIMRRGSAPPKRTRVENAELARMRAQLAQRPADSGDDTSPR